MNNKIILIMVAIVLAVVSTAIGGENKEKAGGPYQHQESYSGVRYTFTEPFPVRLLADDQYRILRFYFRGDDFHLDDVNLETVRVNEIPSYTEPVSKEGAWLVTDAHITHFLGASGFTPIPLEGIKSTYTISFDLLSGENIEMVGDFELEVMVGDLNFDGKADISDIQFLIDYLYYAGDGCILFGVTFFELMDIDQDGDIDEDDAHALAELIGLR